MTVRCIARFLSKTFETTDNHGHINPALHGALSLSFQDLLQGLWQSFVSYDDCCTDLVRLIGEAVSPIACRSTRGELLSSCHDDDLSETYGSEESKRCGAAVLQHINVLRSWCVPLHTFRFCRFLTTLPSHTCRCMLQRIRTISGYCFGVPLCVWRRDDWPWQPTNCR